MYNRVLYSCNTSTHRRGSDTTVGIRSMENKKFPTQQRINPSQDLSRWCMQRNLNMQTCISWFTYRCKSVAEARRWCRWSLITIRSVFAIREMIKRHKCDASEEITHVQLDDVARFSVPADTRRSREIRSTSRREDDEHGAIPAGLRPDGPSKIPGTRVPARFRRSPSKTWSRRSWWRSRARRARALHVGERRHAKAARAAGPAAAAARRRRRRRRRRAAARGGAARGGARARGEAGAACVLCVSCAPGVSFI